MDNILVKFSFLDDPEQRFRSAHLPITPRLGDFVQTPPPRARRYQVVAVVFECDGSRADETSVVCELRATDALPA